MLTLTKLNAIPKPLEVVSKALPEKETEQTTNDTSPVVEKFEEILATVRYWYFVLKIKVINFVDKLVEFLSEYEKVERTVATDTNVEITPVDVELVPDAQFEGFTVIDDIPISTEELVELHEEPDEIQPENTVVKETASPGPELTEEVPLATTEEVAEAKTIKPVISSFPTSNFEDIDLAVLREEKASLENYLNQYPEDGTNEFLTLPFNLRADLRTAVHELDSLNRIETELMKTPAEVEEEKKLEEKNKEREKLNIQASETRALHTLANDLDSTDIFLEVNSKEELLERMNAAKSILPPGVYKATKADGGLLALNISNNNEIIEVLVQKFYGENIIENFGFDNFPERMSSMDLINVISTWSKRNRTLRGKK